MHAVYAADRRHPIEVDAAQREHLATWLSTRLQRKVAPPDLAAAALFMYDNGRGERHSVVVRPMAPSVTRPEQERSRGAMNSAAWIAGGLGFAVVAAAPADELAEVSGLVRRQMPI